ncbi:MAG: hypothetical protein DRO08_04125 [Thermoprotei archaeon]|nr:MAG: hypothetical protein DRO08_04125 [Thermoprotei archaeon]
MSEIKKKLKKQLKSIQEDLDSGLHDGTFHWNTLKVCEKYLTKEIKRVEDIKCEHRWEFISSTDFGWNCVNYKCTKCKELKVEDK